MSALVLPAPEHYRPLLRRLASLGALHLALIATSTLSDDGYYLASARQYHLMSNL